MHEWCVRVRRLQLPCPNVRCPTLCPEPEGGAYAPVFEFRAGVNGLGSARNVHGVESTSSVAAVVVVATMLGLACFASIVRVSC